MNDEAMKRARRVPLNSNCDKDNSCVSDCRRSCDSQRAVEASSLDAAVTTLVLLVVRLHRRHPSFAIVVNPDASEARYSFVLRPACFLFRRWCVTRRRKRPGGQDREEKEKT